MVSIIDIYHLDERKTMDTARIFQSGRSQAVRLPKEYRFAGTEVKVKHVGNAVLLMPSDQPWGILPTALSLFEPGFKLERSQPDEQVRETLLP
jgi:antitoxin VapB